MRGRELAPWHWALAAVLVPVSAGVSESVVLGLTMLGWLTSQTAQSVGIVTTCAVVAAVFVAIRRPWAQAVALAFGVGVLLDLVAIGARLWQR
jgi:hypothetical protein